MTKIRENLATFFSVFAGIFVVYIVLDWGMDITGRRHSTMMAESQEIGKVDGKPILAKDFSEQVRTAVENQKKQTGTEPDESQQKLIRDQIWNSLVDQILFDNEVRRLGITVTDQEIIDWVKGDDPPEMLKRQFMDSTGNFNRQLYDQVIMDPRNKNIMVQVEDYLRKQREREKLQSIILANVSVTDAELRQRFEDQNIKYDANYLLFDPNMFVRDDEVKMTDDDLRRYYNEHIDDYKVEATRKLKYILFNEAPSRADTEAVERDMDDIARRAREGMSFDDLFKTYSELTAPDSTYTKRGQLGGERDSAVFASAAGDIVGPLRSADSYDLIKVISFRPGTDEFLHARHILIRIENNDSTAALKEARKVLAEAKAGKDFAELARTYSKDPSSAVKGGDVGWFSKGRMVKAFEEAAFKAKNGQILGPVRSQFGYHIIQVLGRDKREVLVKDIRMSVHVSPQTRSEISQRAQDFAYLAKQGSFEREAELSKYRVQETQPFQKDAVIPGIGVNQAINKFAFNGKLSATSEPFTLDNGFGVFLISDVREAGLRPFEEVKQSAETALRRQIKMDRTRAIAREMRQTLNPGDSLSKLTPKNPALVVQRLTQVTLGGFLPGVGRDLGFIGGLAAMKPGEISQPIEGSRGIFLVSLLSKTPFDTTAFNAQKETLRLQVLNEKRNRYFADWNDQLKKSADILDKRDMFYR